MAQTVQHMEQYQQHMQHHQHAAAAYIAGDSHTMLQYQSEVVQISWTGLCLAASLILVQCTVSARLGLGMHTQLLIAAIRCVLQLSLLGHILVPIFDYGQLWLVLAYAAFMVWISAVEAIGRPARYYKGMFSRTLLIISMCASSILVYALLLVIGVKPWWAPQYLIPILGMVLGNAISGISVGLSTVVEELSSGKDQIERMLSLGATRYEATADLVGRSIRLAMTPLLNTMSVVGLVSIPGMMTGQILSGSDPAQAARYQMVIMFLLGACGSTAAVASVYAAVSHVVDGNHRLRPERLIQRVGKGGVNGFINKTAGKVYSGGAWLGKGIAAILCCSCPRRRNPAANATAAAAPAAHAVTTSHTHAAPDSDLRQPLLGPSLTDHNSSSKAKSHLGDKKSLAGLAAQVPRLRLIGVGSCTANDSSSSSLIRGGSGDSYLAGGSSSSSVRGMSGDFVDVRVVLEGGDSSSLDSSSDKLSELSDSDIEPERRA